MVFQSIAFRCLSLLGLLSLVLLVLGQAAVAQGSAVSSAPSRSLRTDPIPMGSPLAKPVRQVLDVDGIPVSDFARLLLASGSRPYSICPAVLADRRLVSIRSQRLEDGFHVLRRLGYELTTSSGVVTLCDVPRPSAGGFDTTPTSEYIPSASELEYGQAAAAAAPPAVDPRRSMIASRDEPDFLTRLVDAGYEPAGCISSGSSPSVLFKSADQRLIVPFSRISSSPHAYLVRCRLT